MKWVNVFTNPGGHRVGGLAWANDQLLISDPDCSVIHAWNPLSNLSDVFRAHTGGASALTARGGEVFGAQEFSRRVVEYCADGSTRQTAFQLAGAYHNMPAGIFVDAQGDIWVADAFARVQSFGPQIFPYLPHASILRMSRNSLGWVMRRMSFDTRAPQSVAVSLDGKTVFVSEGDETDERREIRAYMMRTDGSLAPPRTLHTFGFDHSGPHAGARQLTIASSGELIAVCGSLHSGPRPSVLVFSAEGDLLRGNPLPSIDPTSCCLTPKGTLYVGTREGGVYACDGF